jgi:hypothetical protein
MPRFYFDVRNGHGLEPDADGVELLDDEAAQREAVITLTDIAKSHSQTPHRMSIEVKDAARKPLFDAVLTLDLKRHS